MSLLNFYKPNQNRLNPQFQSILEQFAGEYGGPLGITSGYRDPAYNASVGGAKGSFHTKGEAADIDLSGKSPEERAAIVQGLMARGARGFGLYANSPDMLHVDTRGGGPVHFMYDRSSKHIDRAPDWFKGLAGQPPGPNQGLANEAMVALGKQPLHNHDHGPAAASGADMSGMQNLLNMLRGGGDAAPQPTGPLGKVFGEGGFLNEDRRHRLAAGLEGMTLNPNQARIQSLLGGVEERRKDKREASIANRTAAWLEATGRPDLAALVAAGSISGKEAVGIAMTPPADNSTAMMKNFEFFKSQGMTDQQALEAVRSGSSTNVNVQAPGQPLPDAKTRDELQKNTGEQWAGYLQAGANAGAMINDMTTLQELATMAPTGPLQGRLAQRFPELSNAGAAFQSIVKRLAPQMRPVGSGSTSDIEYAGFLASLPSLLNDPAASRFIAQTFITKGQLDRERAKLVQQYQLGKADFAQTTQALADLDEQAVVPPELLSLIKKLDSGEASGGSTSGGATQNEWIDPETGAVVRW